MGRMLVVLLLMAATAASLAGFGYGGLVRGPEFGAAAPASAVADYGLFLIAAGLSSDNRTAERCPGPGGPGAAKRIGSCSSFIGTLPSSVPLVPPRQLEGTPLPRLFDGPTHGIAAAPDLPPPRPLV